MELLTESARIRQQGRAPQSFLHRLYTFSMSKNRLNARISTIDPNTLYYINKYNILSLTDESAPVVSGPSSVRAVSVFCIRRFDETTSRFCVTAFADQQRL